jgi:GR25 family glycosyltransferase involved in LPS biosynthesis
MPEGGQIPVLIINLERDAARREDILAQFAEMPAFDERILTGVAGNTLPNLVCRMLTESEHWLTQKGAIGCFLSHVRAWEQISEMTTPYALVVEDDADIAHLDEIRALELPRDAEFIFINDRMARGWDEQVFRITSMYDSLLRKDIDRVRPGPIDRNGFGTDGYLVTPQGARKLVEACRTDLYFGHVDGRLLRYVTAPADLERLPDESWVKGIISHHHNKQRLPQLGLLKGYCVSRGLVKHRVALPSSREIADAL